MATLYTHKDANIRKTWLLMALFLAVIIAVGWFISLYLGDPAILYVAIVFALVMNVGAYWFSDKIVIQMTGARPVTKAQAPELYRIVENLSITAGLPLPKVYVVDDPAPNAFATGRNPEHAAVAVTTGLLQILEKTELEGVLAHELSHIGNRDMLVSTVAVVLAGFVAIVADIFMRTSLFGGGRDNDNRIHPIVLVLGIVGIILAPLAAQLLRLAVSRKREYLADASGALLTRYPEGLASALEKISSYARPLQRANHATAHLFISDPFGAGERKSVWNKISNLFATHPPIPDRVRALRGSDAQQPGGGANI
ncbi:zinc metalloprotease HtpX [Candidatus Kaiserbacteria bacterium]|nr:zinc metalloprotease HtpX [Candidatus Kaiserbacteria bacterium]